VTTQVPSSRAFEKLRVAVVDDNAAMRGIIRAVLSAFGCTRIYEAGDARSAVELLRAEQIDVLICDWKMDPVDGLALVRLLRNPEKSPNPYIPIIMLTAYAEKSKVQEARDAGATEFMTKPFSAEALYKRLQVIVNKPRPFVRTKAYFGPNRRRVRADYEGPERREDAAI